MDDEAGSGHLWQVVGACAGAVAALVALAAYLRPPSSSGTSASAPATSAHAVAASRNQSTAPAANPPSSEAATVLAESVLRMGSSASVDVGMLPLTVGEGIGGSFWQYDGKIHAGEVAEIARWSGAGKPTAAGCADLLRTQPIPNVTIHVGLRFCTAGYSPKRIAVGQVLSYDGEASQIRVTVWDALLD